MASSREPPKRWDPAILVAARAILEGSLGIVATERVVIVVDDSRQDLADAFQEIANEARATAVIRTLESYGPRPCVVLPAALRADLATAQASLLLIDDRVEETPFRRAFIEAAGPLGLRHAHLVGLSRQVLERGFGMDANRIQELTRRVRVRVQPNSHISARSAAGTHLEIKLDPSHRCGEEIGMIRPGKWENLPAGQLYACPAEVQGVFVADASISAGVARGSVTTTPISMEIEGGVCKRVRSSDARLAAEVEHVLRSTDNLARVGQIVIGTNAGLSAPIGNSLHDACVPGLHLVFGWSNPPVTGARWVSRASFVANGSRSDVDVDHTPIIRGGRFVI